MRRRDFLTLAAGTAAALPFGVRAQRATPRRGPGGRPWLIGALVSFTKVVSDAEILGPFVKGLFELDYVEGRDFRIEARYDDGDTTRDAAFARELVALRPDLLATNGGVTAVALSAATTTIPI